MNDQRSRNRAATTARILDAVHGLLVDTHPANVSMPVVAERAGVGLRTLYRYFPTKGALLDAASMTMAGPALEAAGGPPTSATMSEYLRVSWKAFAQELPAVQAQHLSPAGRQLRARRLPWSRQTVAASLEADGVELTDHDRARLVDLVVAMSSSSMFLEMVDRLDRDPEDAAELVAWAITTLSERARRDGGITP